MHIFGSPSTVTSLYKWDISERDKKNIISYKNYIFYVLNSFFRIFTACDNKTYGLDCRESCGNCSNGEPCHHVDGTCPSGCDAGAYGVTCKQSCGNCSNGDTCNDVDGSCPSGCDVGVYGKTCDEGIV